MRFWDISYLVLPVIIAAPCSAQLHFSNMPGGLPTVPVPTPSGQVKMGATADDIMRQSRSNSPFNTPYGNDQRQNQQAVQEYIRAQMAKDPAYNPSLRNSVSNNHPLSRKDELYRQITGLAREDNARAKVRGGYEEDFNAPEFAAKTLPYTNALNSLKDMLSGKQKMSIAQAYFIMENAWGEAYMTQQQFTQHIQQCAAFIRQWMKENNLNPHSNAAINYAVQQFMGNKLVVSGISQTNDAGTILQPTAHDPYSYDFVDNAGFKDHRNFFLTKCLATGTGQCNSMPAVYLTLVEALGGEAYLTIVPQHSLIKYPDEKGRIRNYEPTSHWDITNEWYQDNMFVGALAIKNKLYLQPLSKKQIIADIILQLSLGYFRKHGGADSKFINECVRVAKTQFPQNNNIIIYFTIGQLYGHDLLQAMRRNGFRSLDDIGKSAETQKLYERWQANEQIITNMGYQDEPRDMYEEMLKYHEFKGRIQKGDGKAKRNLFTPLN